MRKFRKKPVVIEAWQVGSRTPKPEWLKYDFGNGDDYVVIRTLEGDMRGVRGDWIVKGTKGELYPVKPEIFEEIYEAVEP